MATYSELRDLFNDAALLNRTDVAVMIEAQIIIDLPTPTQQDQNWAAHVLNDPRAEAEKALKYMLAVDNALDIATIQAVTDAQLQVRVNGSVEALVAAFNV
jgi:hypothetical protein